jgi:hypothetical protein
MDGALVCERLRQGLFLEIQMILTLGIMVNTIDWQVNCEPDICE